MRFEFWLVIQQQLTIAFIADGVGINQALAAILGVPLGDCGVTC